VRRRGLPLLRRRERRVRSLNRVTPTIVGYSLTDEFRPTSKLFFNFGLRLDRYDYRGNDTTGSPARAFWFNAFNNGNCLDTAANALVDKMTLGGLPSATCASFGGNYTNVGLQNRPSQRYAFDVLQPRLGATYTLDPLTVLRASYGKYNEQPTAAYEQYDALQQNLPAGLLPFYAYGFRSPGHDVRPSISYNADFSLEHQFKGTPLALKLTPFYRNTRDQLQSFYLDFATGFVSGFNVGEQTSRGFELALDAGDFARNGVSAALSFAYTNSFIRYRPLANGRTIVDPINADIANYNAYTSACARATPGKPATAVCGTTSNKQPAAPCYTPAGVPDPACAAGSIANPYWNAAAQPLLDPKANYVPFSTFPGRIGSGVNGFDFPYVATLLAGYRHGPFSITPSLQFQAGNRYGAPETTPGIDPATCTAAGAGTPAADPHYPYGAPGGAAYDATTCTLLAGAIPDPYTRRFDGIGEFRAPSQLLGNVRLSYDVSKRASIVVSLVNVVSRCFGGQRTAFTYDLSPQICSYGTLSGAVSPVGNAYNPGINNVQPFLRYPYEPFFGAYNDLNQSTTQPFSAYVNLRLKL